MPKPRRPENRKFNKIRTKKTKQMEIRAETQLFGGVRKIKIDKIKLNVFLDKDWINETNIEPMLRLDLQIILKVGKLLKQLRKIKLKTPYTEKIKLEIDKDTDYILRQIDNEKKTSDNEILLGFLQDALYYSTGQPTKFCLFLELRKRKLNKNYLLPTIFLESLKIYFIELLKKDPQLYISERKQLKNLFFELRRVSLSSIKIKPEQSEYD